MEKLPPLDSQESVWLCHGLDYAIFMVSRAHNFIYVNPRQQQEIVSLVSLTTLAKSCWDLVHSLPRQERFSIAWLNVFEWLCFTISLVNPHLFIVFDSFLAYTVGIKLVWLPASSLHYFSNLSLSYLLTSRHVHSHIVLNV
jgi:hypothetical protein